MSTPVIAKTPWIYSFLALVVGGGIGYGFGVKIEHTNNEPHLHSCQQLVEQQRVALKQNNDQYQTLVKNNERQAEQLTRTTADLIALEKRLQKQEIDFKKQWAKLAQKKEQLAVSQQQLEVTKHKLDTEVVQLKTTTQKQQQVIKKSQAFYQRQADMKNNVKATQAEVNELQQTATDLKKACDEFKSGNSWNWVSQQDCDKYEQQLSLVNEKQTLLREQQQALAVINSEINAK